MAARRVGEFAEFYLALGETPDTEQLVRDDNAFDNLGRPTDALRNRVFLLEGLYRYVMARHAEAEERALKGSKAEQHDAVAEFATSFGLVVRNTRAKQLLMLVEFAHTVIKSGHGEEYRAAIAEHRKANLPMEIRKAAVSAVKEKFGVASWAAARRQLTGAQSDCEEFFLFRALPIPGGDLGEN